VISAVAFTTVLGTVSGLIMAASGAVAHDLMENVMGIRMTDRNKVRAGKASAVVVGLAAVWLGILFEKLNVTFLVGWAFNVAASANLPALVMMLFWRGRPSRGSPRRSSSAWPPRSPGSSSAPRPTRTSTASRPERALVPFSQPGLVTIPLGFVVLIVVSLLTPPEDGSAGRPSGRTGR
jgi:cation/acetate symporter